MKRSQHVKVAATRNTHLRQFTIIAATLLILKTILSVALNLPDYFSPNFNHDFLRGRETHFFGSYQYAFYTHILSGPTSLFLGLLLLNDNLRRRSATTHRYLGRLQITCILSLVVPSGLWMAQYAQAGISASVAFSALSLATGLTALMGWRCAVSRSFAMHQRWMTRCFTLLCSAVVIRVLGGFASIAGITWSHFDVVSAWLCWIVPLAILEFHYLNSRRQRSGTPANAVS